MDEKELEQSNDLVRIVLESDGIDVTFFWALDSFPYWIRFTQSRIDKQAPHTSNFLFKKKKKIRAHEKCLNLGYTWYCSWKTIF